MGGFLGMRSSSVSLDKQLQKRFPIIQTARKLSKMVKEKEKLFMRFFMVAKRKRIGMLLLCAICAAIFFWVLNVEEGEGSQQVNNVQNNNVNESIVSLTSNMALPPPPPSHFLGYTLPPGHPCNSFTPPPPPANKKRTGPHRTFEKRWRICWF